MRIPTIAEYDLLVKILRGDNNKMHWRGISSWTDDPENELEMRPWVRAVLGHSSATNCGFLAATTRYEGAGFRPTFELMEVETLASQGELSIVGTLYMDGHPVEIPQNPDKSGDVVKYIPGAKLEVRPSLGDPAYIVTGYRVGNVVVADRVLLNQISYEDIEFALSAKEAK